MTRLIHVKKSSCGQCDAATRRALSYRRRFIAIETRDETRLGSGSRLFLKTNSFQGPLQMIFPLPPIFHFPSEEKKFLFAPSVRSCYLAPCFSKLYFMWNEGSSRVGWLEKYPSYQTRSKGILSTYVVISGSLQVHSLKINQVRILGRKGNRPFYNNSHARLTEI